MINNQNIPHLIKYMGAKREILEYVTDAIQDLGTDSEWLCDLFSGTSVITASLKDEYNIHTNDIQQYSSIFGNTYLLNLNRLIPPQLLQTIEDRALFLVSEFKERYPQFEFDYSIITDYLLSNLTYLEFLVKTSKKNSKALFLLCDVWNRDLTYYKSYYSGTYWSAMNKCIKMD